MQHIVTQVTSHLSVSDERGATMIEYAIIIGLISIAAVVLIGLIGTDVTTAFSNTEGGF